MDSQFAEIIGNLRKSYKQGLYRSYDARLHQLNQFLLMLEENEDIIFEALKKDLNKSKVEANLLEVLHVKIEIGTAIKNLSSWMKPERVTPDLINKMNTCEIISEPFGVVLVIGAWNYPITVTLGPVVGAIAAGNSVIIKPSELSVNTSQVIADMVQKYMSEEESKETSKNGFISEDKDFVRVIQGGVPETTALLRQRFDYICYTGGSTVGKIVMRAAAEHLTPVTLELGGKCPAIVDSTCDFEVIGQRIAWAKYCNAGQTCISVDYVICIEGCRDKVIESLKKAIIKFYGEDPKLSDSYGRIINKRHFKRICDLINTDKVVYGNMKEENDLFISPTILTNITPEDNIMKEEIFGPLLPIMEMSSVDEAIEFIKDREKPLALYIFSNNQTTIDRATKETSSGGVCVNDAISHVAVPSLPFGGVGQSGMGAYHGKFSFDTFSHKKSYLYKNQRLESVNALKYPPYDENSKVLQWLEWMLTPMKAKK